MRRHTVACLTPRITTASESQCQADWCRGCPGNEDRQRDGEDEILVPLQLSTSGWIGNPLYRCTTTPSSLLGENWHIVSAYPMNDAVS